jgi:hypothetical protein
MNFYGSVENESGAKLIVATIVYLSKQTEIKGCVCRV